MSLRARLGVQRGHFTVDVDLTVEPGHTLAILGPNGAGKTTILHALAGLAHLDDGHITVDETTWATPETDLPPEKRSVGLLAADHLLFPHLSALDNVAFGPRSRGTRADTAYDIARRELARLGLADTFHARRPHQLSHGQAQRVALARALELEPSIQAWAQNIAHRHHALFLGRGRHWPIALEGALKLKEISYIHAEAYAAGELKHGPLALVDRDMPVIAVAPNDSLLDKLKSNLKEVQARGGELYVFADADSHFPETEQIHVLRLPEHYGELSPILHVVPLQLLAYHTALAKGTDVDKPRNLAKSVTVE